MNIQKASQRHILCTYFKKFLKKESELKLPVFRNLPKSFVNDWNMKWSINEKNKFAKFYLQHNIISFNAIYALYTGKDIICDKNQCIPILNLAKRVIKN